MERFYTMMCFLIFCLIGISFGFLLEPTNQKGSNVSSGNYITTSTFYQEQGLLQQTIDRLRIDMIQINHNNKNSLTLLASQLQQRFDDLEGKLKRSSEQNNLTGEMELFEHKYTELENNFTKLEEKYRSLMGEYKMQKSLLATVNFTQDMKFNQMNNIIGALQNEFAVNKKELEGNKNRTLDLKRDISLLKGLQNIKPLQDFQSLQQQVQAIRTDTQQLNANEQARRQDFLALYNKTTQAEKWSQSRFKQIEMAQKQLSNNLTKEINEISSNLSRQIDDMVTHYNSDLSVVRQQVANATERVALTSCISIENTKSSGSILKFDDVRSQVGISHISSFKSTGKFTCEHEGLYHISVSVTSYKDGGKSSIYKNAYKISSLYNSHNSGGYFMTTGVVVVELQVNDNVYVKTDTSMYVYAREYSCVTIVKIK